MNKIIFGCIALFVCGCAAEFDHGNSGSVDNQSPSDSGTILFQTDLDAKLNPWEECKALNNHFCSNKELGVYICSSNSCPQPE